MDKLNASVDELKKAYYQTDYSFTDGNYSIVIRLDEKNPELLSYLKKKAITSWAYITAWNPLSFKQTDDFNQSQQQHLLECIKDYNKHKGEGKGRDGNWPGEESYFVANIDREEASILGLDFGQVAILVSGKNLEPELLILYPEKLGSNSTTN